MDRTSRGILFKAFSIFFVFSLVIASSVSSVAADALTLNAGPPADTVSLIFIHHSTGENWLNDSDGGLGISLRDNNYFVSDTNYGWGPDGIGDYTDIGDWWLWFNGPDSTTYLDALYTEGGQHSSYSRLTLRPAGANKIVMFKSCFPNSALKGSPDDPVPPIGSNPLRGQDSGSDYHTVANAKGIYIALLDYFRTKPGKLFVVIAAPPLSDPTYSSNAREFNQWLANQWLKDYPYNNVAVFDFYNVLTTNGGGPNINDLNKATGNHHRFRNGAVQHKTNGDDDLNPNVLEYPSSDGDHPSRAGNLKATAEFQPLLNIHYNCWKGTGGCPRLPQRPTGLAAKAASSTRIVLTWKDISNYEAGYKVERRPGGCETAGSWTEIASAGEDTTTYTNTGLPTDTTYAYRVRAYTAGGNSAYSNCAAARTAPAGTPPSPTNLAASSASTGRITLSWNDNSAGETGFRIYRATGTDTWSLLHTAGPDTEVYADTAAEGNDSSLSYRYYIKACNDSGCSPATNAAKVPYRPTGLLATPSTERIDLTWEDNSGNESGFRVYRKPGTCLSSGGWTAISTVGKDVTSYSDTALAAGTSFSYKVRAYYRSFPRPYANGYSLFSNCASASVP